MQKVFLLLIISCSFSFSFSQTTFKPSYRDLKQYEGIYKVDQYTLSSMAASPADTILYEIVHQSRYALKSIGPDLFQGGFGAKIFFCRDRSGKVTGYLFNNDTVKLLSINVSFPLTMWYPRLKTAKDFVYKYEEPKNNNDGLQTGNAAQSGLDTSLLAIMMHKIIDGEYNNVHSVLIIKDGKLVFEQYFYQYTADSVQEMRSATKSIVSALTGIAINKGFIKSKDEPVLSYFPEYTLENMSADKKRITIADMLSQQTGLDCDISNEKSVGNETTMDYSDDWVKFTLNLPMVDTPGGRGMYCSGNPVTIGSIIEKTTKQHLPDFAKQNLFAPLGITNYHWHFKPDRSNEEDYCQVYLTPREMAKFGLMYLDNGVWKGKQIVPADWVKESFAKHSVVQGVDYGYLWWLKYLDADGVRYYSKTAQGNGGQKIYILPDQNLVVVMTGGNYNSQSPSNEMMAKYILPSFNKKK